jgi:hypothetical protein
VEGRDDAFNSAELFLAAVAACMIKGIERAALMLEFELRGLATGLLRPVIWINAAPSRMM